MNASRVFLVGLLTVSSLAAFSQDQSPYDGNWLAKVTTDAGQYEAEVELKGGVGTWKALLTNRESPCVGKKAPIAVVSSTPTELSFKIKMSEALAGCPDSTVSLKRVDEKSLSGSRGRQRVLLVRQ